MIFFTSDLHLGHENSIEFKNRPFSGLEEMNQTLIHNINDIVAVSDELWILGDFSYKINKEQVRQLRRQIQCKHVHLIYGNHDKQHYTDNKSYSISELEKTITSNGIKILEDRSVKIGDHIFQSVQHYKELKTDYGRFILFHYPIVEWNAAHYGSVHLHGHIHSTGEYNAENLKKSFADRFPVGHAPKHPELKLRIYDVGVDANHYFPVSLEQIATLMGLTRVREN